jgi:hypothetical protein
MSFGWDEDENSPRYDASYFAHTTGSFFAASGDLGGWRYGASYPSGSPYGLFFCLYMVYAFFSPSTIQLYQLEALILTSPPIQQLDGAVVGVVVVQFIQLHNTNISSLSTSFLLSFTTIFS